MRKYLWVRRYVSISVSALIYLVFFMLMRQLASLSWKQMVLQNSSQGENIILESGLFGIESFLVLDDDFLISGWGSQTCLLQAVQSNTWILKLPLTKTISLPLISIKFPITPCSCAERGCKGDCYALFVASEAWFKDRDTIRVAAQITPQQPLQFLQEGGFLHCSVMKCKSAGRYFKIRGCLTFSWWCNTCFWMGL